MFSSRQTADRVKQVRTSQSSRLRRRLANNQLSQHRSAHERWRTSVSEIARCLDAIVFDDQRQPYTITADRISFVCDRVGVRQFTGVARMSEMFFEYCGVGQVISGPPASTEKAPAVSQPRAPTLRQHSRPQPQCCLFRN